MRPVVLVTGVGRRVGIGAGIAAELAREGWDVATNHWAAYDDRMPWGRQTDDPDEVHSELRDLGARTVAIPADLSVAFEPARVLEAAETALGPVSALVMCHCESVDSSILDTTVESFDRHFAVNARASWLLVAEFARRFSGTSGRIVALTSDHTVHNLPYGASKGALDRIVLAAARELQGRGITANVVNPGPIDTGWMDDALRNSALERNPLGRNGTPQDTANLVAFLLSDKGGWINGQHLFSDGGWTS